MRSKYTGSEQPTVGRFKAYNKHRAAAHSLTPQTPVLQKRGAAEGGAAVRFGQPASPFALEPTFAVVQAEMPADSTATQAARHNRVPTAVVVPRAKGYGDFDFAGKQRSGCTGALKAA